MKTSGLSARDGGSPFIACFPWLRRLDSLAARTAGAMRAIPGSEMEDDRHGPSHRDNSSGWLVTDRPPERNLSVARLPAESKPRYNSGAADAWGANALVRSGSRCQFHR